MDKASNIEGRDHLIPRVEVIDHDREAVLQICGYLAGGHPYIFKIVSRENVLFHGDIKGNPQIDVVENSRQLPELELVIGRYIKLL